MNVQIGGRYVPPNPLFSHPMWGAVVRALTPRSAAPVPSAYDVGGQQVTQQYIPPAAAPPANYSSSYDVGGQQVTPQYVQPHVTAPQYYSPTYDVGGQQVVPGVVPSLMPPPGQWSGHQPLPSFDWSHPSASMDPGFNGRVPAGLIAALRALAGHSNFHPM